MSDIRILVADDQPAIVQELLRELNSKEFEIDFEVDGNAAFERMRHGSVYDLLVVDMRMPPDVWGGLWLIEKIRSEDIHIPIIVLSGEAGQSETIQALRLGADDWITKENAPEELSQRIHHQLGSAAERFLAHPSSLLPTPIAEKLEHYRSVTASSASSLDRGLAAITTVETIWRFLALVNLASMTEGQILHGIVERQLLRPTMGIYLDLLRGSQRLEPQSGPAQRLASCMPLKQSQQVVFERNRGVGHPVDKPALDPLIINIAEQQIATFVRRYSTNDVGYLASAQSMTYNGSVFEVAMHVFGSTSVPDKTIQSTSPGSTNKVSWVSDTVSIELWPWMLQGGCDESDNPTIYMFDGVKVKGKGLDDISAPFLYTGCSVREPRNGGGTLADLLKVFESET